MTVSLARPWRRRDHEMPPALRKRVAPPEQVREWTETTRRGRTCWFCGVTYLSARDADECELAAETCARQGQHPISDHQ